MSRTATKLAKDNPDRAPANCDPCQHMAETGDVEGLWRYLTSTEGNLIDIPVTFQHLLHAVEVASQRDPAAFATAVLTRLIACTTWLALRGQYYLISSIPSSGNGAYSQALPALPEHVVDVLLPQQLILQRHLTEMIELQARTVRAWGLAGRKAGSPDPKAQGTKKQPLPHPSSEEDDGSDTLLQLGATTPEESQVSEEEEIDRAEPNFESQVCADGGTVAGDQSQDRSPIAILGEARSDRRPPDADWQSVDAPILCACRGTQGPEGDLHL